MIWNSVYAMTFIDLVVIAISFLVAVIIYKFRSVFSSSNSNKFLLIIAAGIFVIAGSYGVDLFIMHALPHFIGAEQAMSAMTNLHLNISWIAVAAGFGAVTTGLILTIRATARLTEDLRDQNRQLVQKTGELEAIEIHYRDLVINSEFGIRIERPGGDRLFTNDGCAQMFGFDSVEEYLEAASKPGTLIAPHDRERLLRNLEARKQGKGALNEYEYDALKKDGSILPVQVFVREIRWDGGPAFLRTFLDISDRREVEKTDGWFRAIIDHSPSLIYLKDLDSRMLVTNKAYEEHYGVTREDANGQQGKDWLGEETFEKLSRQDGIVLSSEQSVQTDLERTDGKNTTIYLNSIKFPVRNPAGEIIGIGGISTNITDRKMVELEREHAIENLLEAHRTIEGQTRELTRLKNDAERGRRAAEAADRAKSEFLANMSHELRTPLNAIIGFAESMHQQLYGPVGNQKYLEYTDDIQTAGRHLLEIINDILDLAKIEAGEIDINGEAVSVPNAIRSCVQLVKARAEAAGVNLSLNVPDNLPALFADRRMLKQVLINLLSNGIKFTPAGGDVKIKARCCAKAGYRIEVVDSGIGIAPDDINKAMTSFKQIDSDLNRKFEGTGLGLPLSKCIAEAHGGSLELQSEVGVGTLVRVQFPPDRTVSQSPTETHTKNPC